MDKENQHREEKTAEYDPNDDPLKRYDDFQEHKWDYGGQVPQFQYTSTYRKSNGAKYENPALVICLIGFSLIILVLGIALHYGALSVLVVMGIWIIVELIARRNSEKEEPDENSE